MLSGIRKFCGNSVLYLRDNLKLSAAGFVTGVGAGFTGGYFYDKKMDNDFLNCAQGHFFVDNAFIYNCTALASDCYNTALNCTSTFNLDTLQQAASDSAYNQLENDGIFSLIGTFAFFGILLSGGVVGTLLFCGTKAIVTTIQENSISHVSNSSELSRGIKEKCLSLCSIFSRNKTQHPSASSASSAAVVPSLLDTTQRNNLSDANSSEAREKDEKDQGESERIAPSQ